MSAAPTLYAIEPSGQAEQLAIAQVWTQTGGGPLPSALAHVVPLTVACAPYLLAVDAGGATTALAVADADPFLTPAPSAIALGRAWDVVQPLTLAGRPHLLAYAAATGEIAVFAVDDQLAIGTPFTYSRVRAPGVTAGFSVVQPVVVGGLTYLLCYAADSGDVNAYSLDVTATPQPGAPAGSPALLANPVWVHAWAPQWTRFAFFTLGAETFFLKTNTGKLNVNIDHVLDDPSEGTVEVGTYLQLDRALELTVVSAFTLGGGDPYFLAYLPDGTTTAYRIHADCQGWTAQATLAAVAGAQRIVPFALGGRTLALFC